MHVAENEACINQKECHNLNIFLALNSSSCIPRPTDKTLIEQLYSVNIFKLDFVVQFRLQCNG
jgi:hypothetical protein